MDYYSLKNNFLQQGQHQEQQQFLNENNQDDDDVVFFAATGRMLFDDVIDSYDSFLNSQHHNDDRQLTFLDSPEDRFQQIENPNESREFFITFSVLAGCFFVVGFLALRVTQPCPKFVEWNAVKVVFPFVCWALCAECATQAYDSTIDPTTHRRRLVNPVWALLVYVLQSFVAPALFLSSFLITYLAHCTRSVPFCGVLYYRGHVLPVENDANMNENTNTDTTNSDPNNNNNNNNDNNTTNTGNISRNKNKLHPAKPEKVLSPMAMAAANSSHNNIMRWRRQCMLLAIRIISLGLLVINIAINVDLIWADSPIAGRTGWVTVIFDQTWTAESLHIVLALLPMGITSISCLYFSIILWRYGSTLSMVIYGSFVNPWVTPVFGAGLLIAGQWFGPKFFPVLSNAGILSYTICMLRLLIEVQRDVQESRVLGQFLDVLSNEQVAGTVADIEIPPPRSPSPERNQHSSSSRRHHRHHRHHHTPSSNTSSPSRHSASPSRRRRQQQREDDGSSSPSRRHHHHYASSPSPSLSPARPPPPHEQYQPQQQQQYQHYQHHRQYNHHHDVQPPSPPRPFVSRDSPPGETIRSLPSIQ